MGGIESVREAGWTQGSVLDVGSTAGATELSSGDTYMVVSHPCDVVSASLEREPTVQLIMMHPIEVVDGNFTFGKNPRRLHIQLETGAFELRIAEMVTIDRGFLAVTTPTVTVDESQRRMLASWLAARYARPVFADEFNRRLDPARRGIEKILKTAGKHISGIYVLTSLDELPEGSPYRTAIALTMTTDDFEVPEMFAQVSDAGDAIAGLVRSMDGIDLASLDTVSEGDISLAHLRIYARWDYESLSHRDSEDTAFPPRE